MSIEIGDTVRFRSDFMVSELGDMKGLIFFSVVKAIKYGLNNKVLDTVRVEELKPAFRDKGTFVKVEHKMGWFPLGNDYGKEYLVLPVSILEISKKAPKTMYFDARKKYHNFKGLDVSQFANFHIMLCHGMEKKRALKVEKWNQEMFTSDKPKPLEIINGEIK